MLPEGENYHFQNGGGGIKLFSDQNIDPWLRVSCHGHPVVALPWLCYDWYLTIDARWLSCFRCSAVDILSWMSSDGSLGGVTVFSLGRPFGCLFWVSCHDSVLSWLSCHGCPTKDIVLHEQHCLTISVMIFLTILYSKM